MIFKCFSKYWTNILKNIETLSTNIGGCPSLGSSATQTFHHILVRVINDRNGIKCKCQLPVTRTEMNGIFKWYFSQYLSTFHGYYLFFFGFLGVEWSFLHVHVQTDAIAESIVITISQTVLTFVRILISTSDFVGIYLLLEFPTKTHFISCAVSLALVFHSVSTFC